jgi:trigger factor
VEAETCRKELVIEIPVEELRRESETVTAQYRRVARIPGFRPGHAPASIVRRHFRNDIRNEVVQSLLPKFFETAVKDQKFSVVGQPHFEDLKFDEDKPLICKATFEVVPEFELKEYQGLEAEEAPATITGADVDKALEELREHAATFEVVQDRPAREQDYVTVNYQGRDRRAPEAPPLDVKDAIVHLGGKGTVAAFTEHLQGAKPGEVRAFEVTYREDYPQKSLAGKTFGYHVEVQSIKQKVVPPLDDDLAKSASEFATLAELREKLRENLQELRKRQVRMGAQQKLVESLLKAHQFPVPQVLVESQLDRKLDKMLAQLLAQGIDPRDTQVDWRKIREEARPEAEKEVAASLLLGRIAAAEKIEVSEKEVDEIIRALAQERRETPAALKTRLTEDGELDRLKSTRRNQKALDFVYHNAKITRKSEEGPARVANDPGQGL